MLQVQAVGSTSVYKHQLMKTKMCIQFYFSTVLIRKNTKYTKNIVNKNVQKHMSLRALQKWHRSTQSHM